MSFIYQAILARVDLQDKSRRVVLLADSYVHKEEVSCSSSSSISEVIPSSADVCSLVEQSISQNLVSKDIDHLALTNKLDLYYQTCMESDFTVCFICVADKDVDFNSVSALFESLRNSYVEVEYVRASILTSAFDELPQFQRYINREIESLNQKMNSQKGGRISDVKQQVDQVKTIMSDNMIRVMERGDRLENLDQRAESLQQSSAAFKTSARRVQRNFCLKNLKWTIILTIVITLLLILGVLLILKTAGVI